ncbi:MAG TPA: hypothetical protein VHB25_18405 [Gemmatimonadaceae bacterium]|nr:hypothetical protein [Gemmatimonadaceae bacterium]
MRHVREAKIRASILHKQLRSTDPVVARAAARRFCRLSSLSTKGTDALIAEPDLVRHAHALTVIAVEDGYDSWSALLASARAEDAATPTGPSVDTERFFLRKMSAFWNRWFTTYAEARESLEQVGGYLFPFRDQFFVCEAGFVEALGADPADQDWARIGFDWIEPRDAAAYERLTRRLVALGFGSALRDAPTRRQKLADLAEPS